MASVLAIDADVLKLAGSGANATAAGATYTQVYLLQAEGMVCLETRYNWVGNVASISTIGKEALRMAVASLAAISVINYDMSGYTSRAEALIMINILWAQYREVVGLLIKDNNYKEFILSGVGDID